MLDKAAGKGGSMNEVVAGYDWVADGKLV